MGNVIGNLLMALLSFLGLGVILLTSGVIFNIIKWAGIAYLMYIGIKLFFDGFIIAVGNPKGIMFFTALFPQFINMQNVTVNLFMVAFGTLGTIAFSCYMLYAVFGVKLNKLFQLKSFRKIFNRISGSLFIGLGLTLAFAKK
jgi:threonine/homoserine/homoserine lactone efflux protein